ncbi:c-type cytochrome biogenesis protein CcmI [Tabrizicola sp.]|uniref:c-type cytochrome biogenesis protein CcmI n=1 Tax=Tabrizicola sp. TaxID=2005166 RepID=UPI00286A20F4|nr:c-type cytochrome biogenesis protein CcmI [Tabrizicola sp.]
MAKLSQIDRRFGVRKVACADLALFHRRLNDYMLNARGGRIGVVMQDWGFWAAALGLLGAVAAILLAAMRRDRALVAPAALDMQVYKDQLAEVERDLSRGIIAADEADRVRVEVSRRLLEADRTAVSAGGTVAGKVSGLGPAAVMVALLASAVAGYWYLGAPGYPDLPLERRLSLSDDWMKARPSQAVAVAATPKVPAPTDVTPEFLALMDKLRTAVADRPTDVVGLELLSRNEAALGNYPAAEAAQRQLIAVKGEAATAADHAALAEILITSAGGFVSADAEAELTAALVRDPANGSARFYSGLLFQQAGRFDRTFALWQPLLEEGPPDAPWIAAIRAQIEDMAYLAGVNYELPPVAGPGADDIAAAEDMSPEDRNAMIAGMVAQLSDRLATDGGSVDDWGKLIRSLVVLERNDEAQTIYNEAKTRFAGRDSELSFLRLAAVETGLQP